MNATAQAADTSGAGPSTAGPILRVTDLHASYGDAGTALDGVSLEVAQGGIVAVLGNNGAGKSTLLRAISGTLPLESGRITGGSIEYEGREIAGKDPTTIVRGGVVQVPEGRRIFAGLTVDENLRAGGLATKDRSARGAARGRVFELFPRLEERLSQKGGLLSGGEQQMLAIGRALMSQPRLLLLDEPSLGLAPQIVEQIAEIVTEINRGGTSVVLVEQNAAMALRISTDAFVLESGRVGLSGRSADLAGSDEVRRRYLGVATEESAEAQAEESAAVTRPTHVLSTRRAEPKTLHAAGVTVRFGGITALEDVSFEVAPGTTHAIIGPNGAGKSTCLNVLTGVYRATSGNVSYGDTGLDTMRPHRIAALGIARTFQNLALSPETTVERNLLVGRHRLTKAGFVAAGLSLPSSRRELAAQIDHVHQVAEIVGLTGDLHRLVHELPYGVRKRVELGRALCAEPDVLLLDEPVAGMNAHESAEMSATIAELRAALGLTIVLVEHDMPFVMGLADRVTVLDFGEVIADGPPDEIQRDPAVLAAYLGTAGAGAETGGTT